MPIPSYEVRLTQFKLNSISSVIAQQDLYTLYGIIKSNIAVPLSVRFSKLNSTRLVISRFQSSLFKNSFFNRALVSWNRLKLDHLPDSLNSFRTIVEPHT